MKTILLWDPRFPDRKPTRLTLDDAVAAAAVRSGVAAAANPAEAGELGAGGALDAGMPTEVMIQHGRNGGGLSRVFLPYSVVMVGALAGVLAAIGTPIAGGVTLPPTPTPSVLRTVSANMIGQASSTGAGRKLHAFRARKYIGSGAVKSITVGLHNWYSNSGTETLYPNDAVFEIYAYYNGVEVIVTKDSSPVITVPSGATDFKCDAILPGAFGVAQIPRGDFVELRGTLHRSGASAVTPASQVIQAGSSGAGVEALWLDTDGSVTGTAQTLTNLRSPGTAFVVSAGAKYASQSGFLPNLWGLFVDGDPVTELHFGDSIDVGLAQSAAQGGALGTGRNAQATHDAGTITNFTAFVSIAVGGSVISHFNTAEKLTTPYMKYAKYALGFGLTNDFLTTGLGKTPAEALDVSRKLWALLKTQGVLKILQLSGQTRGSGNSTDDASQTIGAGWQAGGNVEQFYALLPAEIAAGRIDKFLNFESWRSPTDRYKWRSGGSPDLTHNSNGVHLDEAIELRAAKVGLFV
ncbi:hypothetical protein U1737_13675 [Sphingomonas sp. LB3N6]|uniref:hypothetical protein n=1 Tax=Sphingomonas fucosidasi TaxID=3096164 RepID=UPI002FCBEC53